MRVTLKSLTVNDCDCFQGKFPVRRELPLVFIVFAVLHVVVLALWPSIFGTAAYAYVFKTWPFFACVSVTSFVFHNATTVAAILCRFNFGKGLDRFRKYLPPTFLLQPLTVKVTSGCAICPHPGRLCTDARWDKWCPCSGWS